MAYVAGENRESSGNTLDSRWLRAWDFIPADNLNRQKARIPLTLALTVTRDPAEMRRILATY